MEKEYLSVKEFAEAAGITPQAVYKKLNNQLKPYLKLVDGKKTIEKSALELFGKPEADNKVDNQIFNQLLNQLTTELNEKSQQLKEKDKQIEKLQQALDQAQRLHAMDKQRILELESTDTLEPEVKPDSVVIPAEKKRWWQWWGR